MQWFVVSGWWFVNPPSPKRGWATRRMSNSSKESLFAFGTVSNLQPCVFCLKSDASCLMPFPPASGPKPCLSASLSRVWAGLAKKVDNSGFCITIELKKIEAFSGYPDSCQVNTLPATYRSGLKWAALGLGLAPLLPVSASAYIGPGAGFAILGSFMVFFFSFVAAVVSMLIWPVRAVYRFIQVRRLGSKPQGDRVVILGLDGLDPKRAQKLMDQGKLPHFQALAGQGSFSNLATTYPAISPVAWSTFATGVNPGKHAIFDFLMPDRKTYLPVLSSTHIGK